MKNGLIISITQTVENSGNIKPFKILNLNVLNAKLRKLEQRSDKIKNILKHEK